MARASRKKPAARHRSAKRPAPSRDLDPPWLAAIREQLGFLERQHGFTGPTVSGSFPSFSIRYEKGPLNVSLASEYYEPPIVFVTQRDPYRSFTVREAIDVLEPDYVAARPETKASAISLEELAAWLSYYARFIERHADELLVNLDPVASKVEALRAAN